MYIKPFRLIKNDLQGFYSALAVEADGTTPIDLVGATIVCTMKNTDDGTVKINRQSTGISITDATAGEFEYQWQIGDTDIPGRYKIEFEVTPSGGNKFTIPNPSYGPATVVIHDSLDTI